MVANHHCALTSAACAVKQCFSRSLRDCHLGTLPVGGTVPNLVIATGRRLGPFGGIRCLDWDIRQPRDRTWEVRPRHERRLYTQGIRYPMRYFNLLRDIGLQTAMPGVCLIREHGESGEVHSQSERPRPTTAERRPACRSPSLWRSPAGSPWPAGCPARWASSARVPDTQRLTPA